MAVKQWIDCGVAGAIYDALVKDGGKQDYQLKLSHDQLVKILHEHGVHDTDMMRKKWSDVESQLVHSVRFVVEYSDITKHPNISKDGRYSGAFAVSSQFSTPRALKYNDNLTEKENAKTWWTWHIAKKFYMDFKNPVNNSEYFNYGEP